MPPDGGDGGIVTYAIRYMRDGRRIDVWPLTYGRARLSVASAAAPSFYEDEW